MDGEVVMIGEDECHDVALPAEVWVYHSYQADELGTTSMWEILITSNNLRDVLLSSLDLYTSLSYSEVSPLTENGRD
jgi:hypothetical protein